MSYFRLPVHAIVISIMMILALMNGMAVLAQDDASQDFCDAFIALQQTALETCATADEGTLCLGSLDVDVALNSRVESFQHPGDVLPISPLTRLVASPLAPGTGMWGIAVFHVRADLPEDAPEPVQLVVYGGVELTLPRLTEIPQAYHAPMQAFNLRATHDSPCVGMPAGVLISVPEGYRANLMINGLRIVADNQIFIGLPADNSFMSVSRYGTSTGQIVWGNNRVELSQDVAMVLVPMTSIVPSVMVTPGGVIPTTTQEPAHNTRSLEPQFVYVAVGVVDAQAHTYFLQWEVRNALGGIVEFVLDEKSAWQSASATTFYHVIQVSPDAQTLTLTLRAHSAIGYTDKTITLALPIDGTVFHYFN